MKEEKETKELWKERSKPAIRDELITRHLHLVRYVAGRMASGLPSHIKIDDLYSSGVTGLIKAVERYDQSRQSKFESYAILLIKGAIIDELRALDWVPRSVHQKAAQISEARETLGQQLKREPTDEEMAEHLAMGINAYLDLLQRIRPAILLPLNATIEQDEEAITLAERIADDKAACGYNAARKTEFKAILQEAILALSKQEQRVLAMYYYDEMMLKEIGKKLSLSESRISQIHTKALLKLRHVLSNLQGEIG